MYSRMTDAVLDDINTKICRLIVVETNFLNLKTQVEKVLDPEYDLKDLTRMACLLLVVNIIYIGSVF